MQVGTYEVQLLPHTLANFGRNTSQPSLPPQELLTAQNSMGGPPQYPGSRLGGGCVAPENNISSAAVDGPRRVTCCRCHWQAGFRQGRPLSCREILEQYLSGKEDAPASSPWLPLPGPAAAAAAAPPLKRDVQ